MTDPIPAYLVQDGFLNVYLRGETNLEGGGRVDYFFSNHGPWKRLDGDSILDAMNKLKESLDRHTQLYTTEKSGFSRDLLESRKSFAGRGDPNL